MFEHFVEMHNRLSGFSISEICLNMSFYWPILWSDIENRFLITFLSRSAVLFFWQYILQMFIVIWEPNLFAERIWWYNYCSFSLLRSAQKLLLIFRRRKQLSVSNEWVSTKKKGFSLSGKSTIKPISNLLEHENGMNEMCSRRKNAEKRGSGSTKK